MTKAAANVLAAALELPEVERVDLANRILASVDASGAADAMSDPEYVEWVSKIEERARRAIAGAPGRPWPEVRARIEKNLEGA